MHALPISPLLEIVENIVETCYKGMYYFRIMKGVLVLQLLPHGYQKPYTNVYVSNTRFNPPPPPPPPDQNKYQNSTSDSNHQP